MALQFGRKRLIAFWKYIEITKVIDLD